MKFLVLGLLVTSWAHAAVTCPPVTQLNGLSGSLEGPLSKLSVPTNGGHAPTSLVINEGKNLIKYELISDPAYENYDSQYNSLKINLKLTVYQQSSAGCKVLATKKIPAVGEHGGGYNFFIAVDAQSSVQFVRSSYSKDEKALRVRKHGVRATKSAALELISFDHQIVADQDNTNQSPDDVPGYICHLDILKGQRSYYGTTNSDARVAKLKGLSSVVFNSENSWNDGIDEKVASLCIPRKGFVPLNPEGLSCDVGAKLSPIMLAIVAGDDRGRSEPLPDISEVTSPYIGLTEKQLVALQEGRPLTMEFDLPIGKVTVEPEKTHRYIGEPGFTFFVTLEKPTQGIDSAPVTETDEITCAASSAGGVCTFTNWMMNQSPVDLSAKEYKELGQGKTVVVVKKISEEMTNVYRFKQVASDKFTGSFVNVSTEVKRLSIDCMLP